MARKNWPIRLWRVPLD